MIVPIVTCLLLVGGAVIFAVKDATRRRRLTPEQRALEDAEVEKITREGI